MVIRLEKDKIGNLLPGFGIHYFIPPVYSEDKLIQAIQFFLLLFGICYFPASPGSAFRIQRSAFRV